jgi:hypothetical protein
MRKRMLPTRRLDRPVRQVAGGVILKQVVPQMITAGRRLERARRIEIRTMRAREALRAFQHIGTAIKPALGQPRAQQPVIGRLARMQRLAHGAEHGFQTGRLGAGNAQRHRGLHRVQAE